MGTTRTNLQHTFERLVHGEIEDVWRAVTDPDEDAPSYDETVVESSWMPGEPVRFVDPDGAVAVEGTVVDVDAPHRLVHTFAITAASSSDAGGDSPSRVTWQLEPSDDGTLVTLVHDEFTGQTATWRAVEDGWDQVLDGLVERFGAAGDE